MKTITCLILISGCFLATKALECNILLKDTGKNLSEIITTCLIPTIPVVEVTTEVTIVEQNITHDDDPEEPSAYDIVNFFPTYFQIEGPRRGLRIRRDNENKTTKNETTSNNKPAPAPNPVNNNNNNNENGEGNENANDPARCVVHCIMSAYNMLGSKGYPELRKVAASLIKDNMSREMKDFLQDSVDACFLQLSENVDLDSCTYSARLATCLADKGRYNCSDFPIGELPFPHKF